MPRRRPKPPPPPPTPLGPDEEGMRGCLGGCDKEFMSRNAGHRICPKCDRSIARKDHAGTRTSSGTAYDGGASYNMTCDD